MTATNNRQTNFGILTFRPLISEYTEKRDALIKFIGSSECNYFEKYLIVEERVNINEPWSHLHIAFQLDDSMPTTHTGVKRKILERNSSLLPKCENMHVAYDLSFGNKKSSFINSCVYCLKGINNNTGRKVDEYNINDSDYIEVEKESKKYTEFKDKKKEDFYIETPISIYIPELYIEYLKWPMPDITNDGSDDDIANQFLRLAGRDFEEHVYVARRNLAQRGIFCNRQRIEYILNSLRDYITYKKSLSLNRVTQ